MEKQRKPDLGNGTFVNPILGGDYPDPSVLRVGKDYYMTHSSFNYGPGLLIWHSKDLVNWTPVGNAVPGYPGNVWAPDFIKHKELYYIYYPADGSNWVVWAPAPEGPWSEPINLNVGYIDPGHIATPDGKRYLHLSDGHMVPLSDDGLSVTGPVQKVYEGWQYPEDWVVEGFCLESPKLFYRNGYYYLTVAEGGTAGPATSHMVVSSRSTTPWGPWEHSPYNPIVHTSSREEHWWSRGHATLVDTPDGAWWMMYHAYEKGYYTLGRQTLLEPLEWTEDGWFKVPDGIRVDEPITKPAGEAVPHGMALSDDWADGKLGLQWRFFDEHKPERYRFLPEGGVAVSGAGYTAEKCSPMLCIPVDHAYEAEVEVEVSGDAEARLLLFYNTQCYSGIGFSKEKVGPVRLCKTDLDWDGRAVHSNKLHLRLRNEHHEVTLHYSVDGESWQRFPCSLETSGYHHNVFGGFISLRIGLDVIGDGEAVFRRFRYEG